MLYSVFTSVRYLQTNKNKTSGPGDVLVSTVIILSNLVHIKVIFYISWLAAEIFINQKNK